MREDMAKVIVERPRRGASGRLKGRLRGNWEAQPIKQGMKFLLADTKSLNENLDPKESATVSKKQCLTLIPPQDHSHIQGRHDSYRPVAAGSCSAWPAWCRARAYI